MKSCDTISQFCFTLSTTFTRIAIAGEELRTLDTEIRIEPDTLAVSFVMRAYVVVPKVPLAYMALGLLSVIGLMSVILDVVCSCYLNL